MSGHPWEPPGLSAAVGAAHWKVIASSRCRRGPSALPCRCMIGVDHDEWGRRADQEKGQDG